MTTPNDTIQLTLTSRPSGGLNWNLVNSNTGSVFTATTNVTSSITYDLAKLVAINTKFQNRYKAINTSGNFSGSEYY